MLPIILYSFHAIHSEMKWQIIKWSLQQFAEISTFHNCCFAIKKILHKNISIYTKSFFLERVKSLWDSYKENKWLIPRTENFHNVAIDGYWVQQQKQRMKSSTENTSKIKQKLLTR